MAGGVKKPVNVFKLRNLEEPKEVFNWRLWFAVFVFGLLGAARGVDEGLIKGAINSPSFANLLRFDNYSELELTNIEANISAMVQIGSVGGALIAFIICDRIGRVWAVRTLCSIWIVGIAIFMGNSGKLGAVYAGRFVAGLGVGQTVVVGPVYLAEIAPAPIRGLCTCAFTGFVYIGILLAYFSNYGASIHLVNSQAQWMVPTSLHLMFASIIFALSFFQIESPRYLIKKGRRADAVRALSRLRKLPIEHPYVNHELRGIEMQWEEEQESTKGQGPLRIMREIFLVPSNLYRLYLGVFAQIMSQWTGAGSITLYAVDLFTLLGISDNTESLLATAVFGVVKFIAAVTCALFLVDYIGRKRALLSGIALQAISMLYIAGYLTAFPKLGVEETYSIPRAAKGSSIGAIFMIYISGFGWALGWNSMQYLLTAELFPLRIRAVCTSLIMCLHFVNQYGNSRAVPNMLLPTSDGGMDPKGTFWFFFVVTVLGAFWVWITVPETAGRDLESIDRLFALPWYKIGRYGNKDAEVWDGVVAQKETERSEHVENTGQHDK